MLRQRVFYYPLILILLFGVAISLMPASPALGSNLPLGVTVQQVNLGTNSLIRTSHTFTIGSGGTPSQNGAALLAARDVISNSHPSAANPYLIKLEPGNYDLGNQGLALLPFVDLEGSGEDTTVISSTVGQTGIMVTNATLIAASNSEVRLLKVANFGVSPVQAAILVPASASNARFSHVTAAVSNSADFNVGLYTDGKNVNLADTTFTTSGGNRNVGILHNSGEITLTNSIASATGGMVNNAAILDNSNQLRAVTIIVNNSTLTASGGSKAAALAVNQTLININSSTLRASTNTLNDQSIAYGILINNAGPLVRVSNSDITANGGAEGDGIFSFGDIIVRSSSLSGTGAISYGVNNDDASEAEVIGSSLSGGTAASNHVAFCTGSVNERTRVPLNADCK